jgi:hypothetical protein
MGSEDAAAEGRTVGEPEMRRKADLRRAGAAQ